MICRDMRAIIKNVEHEGSGNKFIVAKAVADDNMLWYYGRYPTVEKGMEVARDITCEDIVGVIVFDDDIFSKMSAIKSYIQITEDCIKEKNGVSGIEYAAKASGFDMIRKVVNGE